FTYRRRSLLSLYYRLLHALNLSHRALPYFFLIRRPPPTSTLFPYTTLFRSGVSRAAGRARSVRSPRAVLTPRLVPLTPDPGLCRDRKSTRLNSSHQIISYAVFCLKKKKKITSMTK